MAQNWKQAYGYKFWISPILKDSINFATLLPNAGLGTGKFIDNGTPLANNLAVIKAGTGATLGLGVGTIKTVTNAALATNEATLTFAAAHGYTVGQKIVVANLPAPFASLNGTYTVKAVTTSSPFTLTYDKTGTNITSAAVAAGGVLPALVLDGTASPIRLLGLSNAAPEEGESEETVDTYDDELQGFDASLATKKTFSWTLEGVSDHNDTAYKLLRLCSKESVREGLMVKYARVGPTGVNEVTYGFGRFTGFSETPPAAGVVRWSSTLKAYGPYELEFA